MGGKKCFPFWQLKNAKGGERGGFKKNSFQIESLARWRNGRSGAGFRLNWTIIRGTVHSQREREGGVVFALRTGTGRISRKYAGKETNRAAIQSKLRAWILTNGGRADFARQTRNIEPIFHNSTRGQAQNSIGPRAPTPHAPVLFPRSFSCFLPLCRQR